jgi:uncharacterized protein YcbK (DUF882 family)
MDLVIHSVMVAQFPNKVRITLALALLLSGCALRAHSSMNAEPAVSGSGSTPILAAVAVNPTLSALMQAEAKAAPQGVVPSQELDGARAVLAATTGGVSFEALQSMPKPTALPNGVLVHLRSANSRDEFEIEIGKDGRVADDNEGDIEAFLSCRRTGRMKPIQAGVLRVLAAIAEEYPGRTIEIISGYRAPPFGVKDSKHFDGRAIDLRVKGVKLSKVRDFVWKRFADVGVGYYGPQNFIHVDFRPEEKDTAWSSAHEDAVYEYNPRWAMRIRPPWREPLALIADEDHPHEHPEAVGAGDVEVALSEIDAPTVAQSALPQSQAL